MTADSETLINATSEIYDGALESGNVRHQVGARMVREMVMQLTETGYLPEVGEGRSVAAKGSKIDVSLSRRETQIATIITGSGTLNIQNLARELNLRPKTIDSHLQSMTHRYGFQRRRELVAHLTSQRVAP